MTIPLFSGDARRSLLMQRATDSYGKGGRRLQYSVGFSLRDYANKPTVIARNLQLAVDEVFHAYS
ncbi:hypothetical protein [Nostoc sp. NMS4]|uniref:hypothetical protein n=1 Tax=Nostoc sp. NMS4 TaxID=2815390 RepID=UPI0025E63CE0|nr:hypothetical protein [Nostoc sp. NMS4]MBN3925865.1 hypothetical protein [Nostoc sp. NMS4]